MAALQAKTLKMPAGGGTLPMAQLGTTEHAVLVLTVVEVVLLCVIRRYFKSAHGG